MTRARCQPDRQQPTCRTGRLQPCSDTAAARASLAQRRGRVTPRGHHLATAMPRGAHAAGRTVLSTDAVTSSPATAGQNATAVAASECAPSVQTGAAPAPARVSKQYTWPSSPETTNFVGAWGLHARLSMSVPILQDATAPSPARASHTHAAPPNAPDSSPEASSGFHAKACTLSAWCFRVSSQAPAARSQTCNSDTFPNSLFARGSAVCAAD